MKTNLYNYYFRSFINQIKPILLSIFYFFILVLISLGLCILNVRNTDHAMWGQNAEKIQEGEFVSNVDQTQQLNSVAIEKTAQIIVREGKNIKPATAKKYAKWIYSSGEKHKINPVLILSVMSVESNFNANAKSPTGPIGLLQVAHSWHKEKSSREGLFDPKNNIDVGAQILAEYKGTTDIKTLAKYYGGTVEKSNAYAKKVMFVKNKYENEIRLAVIRTQIKEI